jgi:hypothetical protein
MKKQLKVEVDEDVLEKLGIDETTPLDVSTVGEGLFVKPIHDAESEEKFTNAAGKVNRRYENVLRRLSK